MTAYHHSPGPIVRVRAGSFAFAFPKRIESGPAHTVGYLSGRPATTRGVGSICKWLRALKLGGNALRNGHGNRPDRSKTFLSFFSLLRSLGVHAEQPTDGVSQSVVSEGQG